MIKKGDQIFQVRMVLKSAYDKGTIVIEPYYCSGVWGDKYALVDIDANIFYYTEEELIKFRQENEFFFSLEELKKGCCFFAGEIAKIYEKK